MVSAMTKFRSILQHFRQSKDGATAVEYGLLAAGISIVLITSLTTIGTEMDKTFYGPIGQTLAQAQSN